MDRALWNVRAVTVFLMAFGVLGVTLASVGVYGVVATSVRERSREIGLRMALGAEPGPIMIAVLGRTLVLLGAGATVGLGLAALLSRPFRARLYGVSATDPLTYGVVAGILMLVVLTAAWIPARWATRLDPVSALRTD